MDIEASDVHDVLKRGASAALRRCLVGVPYRTEETNWRIRVWLTDAGAFDSTTATKDGLALDIWPGRRARICVEGVLRPLKFTPSSTSPSFGLEFVTK
jgi:hypothetical protein